MSVYVYLLYVIVFSTKSDTKQANLINRASR